MGASNSLPVTSKFTDGEENDRIKYAVSSMQGWSEKMEDAHAAILHLDDNEATSFFGVYDGLGGSDVASYCARQFHIDLRNHEDYHNNVTNAMKRVFFSMDEKLQQSDEWREEVHPRGTGWMQFLNCANLWQANYTGPAWEGSTACAVIIRGNRIVVGNVGDSRCVLSRNGQAINLSTDHKPERYPEIRRVRKAGGVFVGYSRKKGMREEIKKEEWARLQGRDEWGFYKHYGKVSVSRAIGYFAFKQNKNLPPAEQMLICNPEMRTIGITDDTEFLLIASNSIWECKSSQQVVDFVRQRLQSEDGDLRAICEDLLELGLPSGDNMTAILVQFKAHNRYLQLNPEDEVQPCLDDLDAEDTADSGAGGDVQAWQRPFANPRDENLPSLDYDADDPAFSGADVGVSRRPFSNPEDEIQPSLD